MYDLAIIGSGPGGYVAALRAAQLGMKVALIEREKLGGVCLNWGCIPTKSLLESSEVFALINQAEKYGIAPCSATFDMSSVVERSRSVVDKLTSGIEVLLAKGGVRVFFGSGSFSSSQSIRVSSLKEEIRADKTIIATGARPKSLEGFEFDHKVIWDYKDAMMAPSLPKSLAIIGGGVIGLEFASMYNNFGCKVHVLEAMSRILMHEDEEVSRFMHSALIERGLEIKCGIKLTGRLPDGIEFVCLDQKHTLKVDKILVCIGIRPNSEGIGLENTKVTLDDKGLIKTDSYLRTSDPNIYAIGDVTHGPWLAHKASREAIVCIEAMCGLKVEALNRERVPSCIYSSPQCASIGMSEEEARKRVGAVKVGRFPLQCNGKALASGHSEGFAKVIFDSSSGELLGVHLVGYGVSELIHSAALAIQLETTEDEIINAIFPHPTLSEAFQESALDALGRSVHK